MAQLSDTESTPDHGLLCIEAPSQSQKFSREDSENAVPPQNGFETFAFNCTVCIQNQQSNITVPEASENILPDDQFSTDDKRLMGNSNPMKTIPA